MATIHGLRNFEQHYVYSLLNLLGHLVKLPGFKYFYELVKVPGKSSSKVMQFRAR